MVFLPGEIPLFFQMFHNHVKVTKVRDFTFPAEVELFHQIFFLYTQKENGKLTSVLHIKQGFIHWAQRAYKAEPFI